MHQKSKALKISKAEVTIVRLDIGEEIEQLKEVCYLKSMITTDAKGHREIKRRMAIRKEAF